MAFSLDYGNNDINGYFSGHFWPTACLNTNNISDDMRHTSVLGMETPRRRKRTTFSKAQLSELERTFSLTQYPDVKMKESLSSLTGLAESKIQVWFQNRRARYFKNKKSKRELKSFNLNNVHPHISTCTPNSSASRFHHSLSPRYPSPSFPQYGELPNMLPPPTSPIAADQATNYIERKRFALAQETVGHYPDFTGCSDVFLSNKSPNGWNFLQEFDALFGDDQGSLPTASRCAAANHNLDNGLLSEVKDLMQFHDFTDGRQEQTKVPDDISELCLQELSEFDLEISPAMIDYLLSE